MNQPIDDALRFAIRAYHESRTLRREDDDESRSELVTMLQGFAESLLHTALLARHPQLPDTYMPEKVVLPPFALVHAGHLYCLLLWECYEGFPVGHRVDDIAMQLHVIPLDAIEGLNGSNAVSMN